MLSKQNVLKVCVHINIIPCATVSMGSIETAGPHGAKSHLLRTRLEWTFSSVGDPLTISSYFSFWLNWSDQQQEVNCCQHPQFTVLFVISLSSLCLLNAIFSHTFSLFTFPFTLHSTLKLYKMLVHTWFTFRSSKKKIFVKDPYILTAFNGRCYFSISGSKFNAEPSSSTAVSIQKELITLPPPSTCQAPNLSTLAQK